MATCQKLFAVVLFHSDNSIEAVPANWITDNNGELTCPWPKKKSKTFRTLLSDHLSTPGVDWSRYSVRLIKKYDSYEKAVSKAQRSIIHSGDDSSEVDCQSKRRRKGPTQENQLPPVPLTPFTTATSSSLLITTPDEPVILNAPAVVAVPEHVLIPGSEQNIAVSSDLNLDLDVVNPEIEYNVIPSSVLDQIRNEQRAGQAEIFQKLSEVVQEQKDMNSLLLRVLATSRSRELFSEEHTHPPLPLRTIEELETLENWLVKDENQQQMVRVLGHAGGIGVVDSVNSILKHTISHELALKLRFSDTSGKKAIGNSKLVQVICEAIRCMETLESTTNKAINSCIARWLRNSPDRKGGRQSRKALKQNVNSKENEEAPNSAGRGPSTYEDTTDVSTPSVVPILVPASTTE